jgi:Flavodoxin domain
MHPGYRSLVGYRGPMRAIVIYESLTGNTRKAGHLIADELNAAGIEATAWPINQIDLQALSEADLVIVGSWTDGLILFGQRPGRIGRLVKLPVIDGKTAAVYCTYAIEVGKTLEKLSGVVSRRGGNVIGGMAIKRTNLASGAREFVDRLLGALEKSA